MPFTIRTVLASGLFVTLICLSAGRAEAARRRAVPAAPGAVRQVVRYGRSDFVGPRGYAAVVSPWPLVPVTTPSKPYGVGVVPPGQVVAWQSPAGYFYRTNYQSAVMQGGPTMLCPQPPAVEVEPSEVVPPGTLDVPMESIPTPPAESGPQF